MKTSCRRASVFSLVIATAFAFTLLPNAQALALPSAVAPVAQTPPTDVSPSTSPSAKTLDHKLDTDLIKAVTSGSLTDVRSLLARGADPNAKNVDFFKGTALTVAATYYGGDVQTVQALVEAGAALEGQNGEGETPLTLAVMGNHVELVRYLVKAGADLNSHSFQDTPPLMSAVLLSNAETVRVLLDAGADVNARSANNVTALFAACRSDAGSHALEIVKLLVNAGADVSIKTPNGKTPFDRANESGLSDVAEYLATIFNRDQALFNATARAYTARETADSSTRIANWKAVQDALAAGANPRFVASKGRTSLLFLTYGLPGADDETVQNILAHSDLNAQETQFGSTALHSAADNNNAKMVGWLIQAGARLDVLDQKNRTPLDLALTNFRLDVIGLLQKAGATENPLFVTDNGLTKLMLLAMRKPFDATKAAAFLKAGVDVNATSQKIDTALMFACDASSPDAVKWLLKNGANVNFVDIDGKSALMFGAQLKNGDDALDIVQQLIAAKADVNAKSHAAETALSLARKSSNTRAADALRKAGAEEHAPLDNFA